MHNGAISIVEVIRTSKVLHLLFQYSSPLIEI